jgi:hypothetical protein
MAIVAVGTIAIAFFFCGSLPAAGLSGALCTGGIQVWRLTDPVGAWKEAEVSHW